MTKLPKLVMATNNAGKLREARAIAGDRLEILSLSDIGYHQDIPETSDTLEGNALIKVRAIKDATGLNCFADDTGLIVDALDGKPGVYSARYAGEACDPEANMDLLLKNLEGAADRNARFQTSIALSLDGEEHIFHGTAEGSIATERCGTHGFGYDPVFISKETGKSFAEMTDDEKNGLSHRGRALRAMMKWLGALCVCLIAAFHANAAMSSDWVLYNTYDENMENVFDTPEKTYFLTQAQFYDPASPDNSEKYLFLFCFDKETDELRPYNSLNCLSENLISTAFYNASKRYLMIVYDNLTIDILHDDGKVDCITALKNYSTSSTKNVRSISFDPENNRAYLATDFGFIAIDDERIEVAENGVYNQPVDNIVRVADRLIIQRNGSLYWDYADTNHISLDNFRKMNWQDGNEVKNLVRISGNKCLFSLMRNGSEDHFILVFNEESEEPERISIGSFAGAHIVENRDGLLLTRTSQIVQLNKETNERTFYPRRADDYAVVCGSWDMRDIYFAKSRDGFYSLRRADDNTYTVTRETARPNVPATFRTNNLLHSPSYGMLANTHGINQNFNTHTAINPILLSSLKNGEWEMLGLPYLAYDQRLRFFNPCGIAQDPDNPDVFWFGSVLNGLFKMDVSNPDANLQFTRSNDNPSMPGHISVQEPYADWSSSFMLQNPLFDSAGNLVIAHINTAIKGNYTAEIWMWTPDQRKACVSEETFQPFTRLKVDGIKSSKSALALPLKHASSRNMVAYIPINAWDSPFAVYDHKGTISNTDDDHQALMTKFKDNGEDVKYSQFYCALEDPATGLVWVGTNNGVFTFNPSESFANPGKVSRIKVSRNDGTSLADYLLANISVNHIAIDNKGRKWFSLDGGGIVVTSADGTTILQEITRENSMLPSNTVYATCYNPDNNSMMVGTSAGLCEHFLSGQSTGETTADVRAYPNPVRPDYYGWVTIDGLEDDCLVKISDSAGNIVRELGPASGGSVQWDVCGADLDRVASGVYYVLASAGKDGGGYSEVSKILVIKR